MTYATVDTRNNETLPEQVTGRIVYATEQATGRNLYLYVTAVIDGTILGATVNDEGSVARFVSADLATVQGWSYSLGDFSGWQEPIAALFRTSGDRSGTVSPDALAEAKAEGRAEAKREHDAFLERLVSDAHEYADDNDLCGVFDEFMESHGFPGRQREYVVCWTVTYSGSTTVTGRSEEEAADTLADDFGSYVDRYSVDIGSPDVFDISDVYRA